MMHQLHNQLICYQVKLINLKNNKLKIKLFINLWIKICIGHLDKINFKSIIKH
jgi:hypothetical protein